MSCSIPLSLGGWCSPELSLPIGTGNKTRESEGRGVQGGIARWYKPQLSSHGSSCHVLALALWSTSCPLSWFNKSKEFSHLTSEEAHFEVYLKLSSKCVCTIEAACKDRFNLISQRSDKTLFSRFGVLRPNAPICQKRFVRGHKVSTTLFALAFWFLDSAAGASVQT